MEKFEQEADLVIFEKETAQTEEKSEPKKEVLEDVIESIVKVPVPEIEPPVEKLCNTTKVEQNLGYCRAFGQKGTPGYAKTQQCQNEAVCWVECHKGYSSQRCIEYRTQFKKNE